MQAVLTPDDLKKGDLTDPGWYNTEIVNYEEKITKGTLEKPSDGSTNCIFHFKIVDGPYKGLTVNRLFNEKALGFGKNLWKALKFPVIEDGPNKGGYTLNSDLFKQTIGSIVKTYIKRGTSDKGNPFNDATDWMEYKAS